MSGRKPLLLVIDDEQAILDVAGRFARRAGWDLETAANGREAIARLQTRRADLVLVDLRMPDVGGLDVLRAIRDIDPCSQAVLMTRHVSVETAVEAIKLGAMDYLSKPVDFPRLELLLSSVRDDLERQRCLLAVESDVARRLEFCGMIGRGPAMQELFGTIRRLAPHVRTALVTGEAGTGKELVARALHRIGPRSDRRFVAVNCSAAVDALFESELFGHVRGAITGAIENKPGLFELADNGTVFLEEIAELPSTMQATLLRVLERGAVHRVGSVESRQVNVHVLAATSRDLRAEVAAGRFRSDLYSHLNIVEVRLPPLRDRREDIPYLTAAFVCETSERLQKSFAGLSAGAERLLGAAVWEGNVRELRNVIERACIVADGEFITERELAISMPAVPQAAPGQSAPAAAPQQDEALLVNVEREHIQRALLRANGNKKAAARMLGLSRRALYRRLERLDLGDTIMRRQTSMDVVGA